MFLSSEEFMKLAKEKVYEMALASLCPTDDVKFTIDNVYIVTHAFILKNQKAMVSTTLTDGKYYEVTYNEATSELYVDQYVKVQNKSYNVEEILNKQKPIKNDAVNVQPLYGCPIPVSTTTELDTSNANSGTYYYGIPKESKPEDDRISLVDFVNHVKHEHPDYFPAGEKFVEDERIWHGGVRRDIVRHALTIYGEKSFAILMDADKQSLQDIMYFHINASPEAYSDFVCVGKVTHDDLLRHVVKTLYHMDWKSDDSHQTLWTEQIADILGIPQDKVVDFVMK